MKNRSSTPVDVLNALALPITCVVTPGASSGVSDDSDQRVDQRWCRSETRVCVRSSFHAKDWPTSRTCPAS